MDVHAITSMIAPALREAAGRNRKPGPAAMESARAVPAWTTIIVIPVLPVSRGRRTATVIGPAAMAPMNAAMMIVIAEG